MSSDATFNYDVFISYSHRDEDWVTKILLPRLEAAGLRVCIDYRDFQRGAPSVKEMRRAVEISHKTLLILTPVYLESGWTEFEYLMLQTLDPANRQLRLIPLLKARCDLPLEINYLTYVDFTRPDRLDMAWTQLLTALGAPPVPPAPDETRPAAWCLAHPYPMPPHFTGREDERAMLSDWLAADADHPLLALRALGGFGKSALAWHWLLHDVDPGRWPQVVWWSFYEGDASFDHFLGETLAYLGETAPPPGSRQQADRLLQWLRRPGILLILDGFERVLRAYAGPNAAYQGDDPAGAGQGEADCVNYAADHFLRSLAVLPGLRGRALLTTRLRPRALESHGGLLLQGCREAELTHLQPADAIALCRALGIRGGRAEIEAACAPYGFHPLSLRLLAGLILSDPQQPGDIAAARRLDVSGDLVQRQHHVLAQAYTSLTPACQQLLSRLACFRGPVGYEAVQALAAPPTSPPAGGTEGGLDAGLRDLAGRGLLHHDRRTNRYDLHPIVRRYAYDRLTSGERADTHHRLSDYFAAIPAPRQVQRLDDLAPVIELYHHLARAGQYDEAVVLFRDRLVRSLYFQFGAYQLCIDLLRALFPDGEDRPPRLKEENAQAWTLNALANSYSSGQPRRAVPLFEKMNDMFEKRGDKSNLAIGLGNLAHMAQIYIGALRPAEANLRRQIALCSEIGNDESAGIHYELGRLLAYTGRWSEAAEQFDIGENIWKRIGHIQAQGIIWAYRALRGLLLVRAAALSQTSEVSKTSEVYLQAALAAARRALELADEWQRQVGRPNAQDYVRAHWLLGAAYRAGGNPAAAEAHLAEALNRCRAINLVEFEADILLDLARLRHAGGEGAAVETRRLAEEALAITERSGYMLPGADTHLLLARLSLAEGDKVAALAHARAARALATCDGPPDYTYQVAYNEAGALLAELGER